jgi:transposase
MKAMCYSSDLSDKDWLIIEPLLSSLLDYSGSGRRSKWCNRDFLNGMLYQLKNGCNWCDLPKDYPPYSTVYWHYKKWRDAGIFEKILQKLHEECRISLKKSLNIQA